MKLITILKNQFLAKLPGNDIYFKSFVSIVILSIVAGVLWISGPHLTWGPYAPLVQPEKRFYLIIFLFLVWLLKLLLLDLDAPDPYRYKEPAVRQKLKNLEIRFYGALKFLKKTIISKSEQLHAVRLSSLPWYLLIGPTNAGKTMLLSNSNIHFILQKRKPSAPQQAQESEQCDWWITREASIIDVPGKYLCSQESIKQGQMKLNIYAILWQFFLGLTKYHCGKNGLNGIILTMPLPEIIKENDSKEYRSLMHILFHRIHEIQKFFPRHFPCFILVTKCDLLPGFAEFFAESGNDEINQAWGITLTEAISQEKTPEFINTKFDALIKKLNQQLLWRLHQERNPMARPYIKDFPLQVERVKEYVLDLVKEMHNAKLPLVVKGVYLTSALQKKAEPENHIIEESENNIEHALQIFKEPAPISRAYFIKQFFAHALTIPAVQYIPPQHNKIWVNRIAVAIAIFVIAGSAFILGKDFKQSINQAYAIQNYLVDYEAAIQRNQDQDEHLIITSDLLDTLEATAKKSQFKLDAPYLLAFYSYKSQQKASLFYRQALKVILIPQIKNYFEEYLKNPVNKNTEHVYAALKAYLMLGNIQYYDADFVRQTLEEILPKAMQRKPSFMTHVKLALNTAFSTSTLNANLVESSRKYLTSIPSFRLGYIILKNNSHFTGNPIHVGAMTANNEVFINRQVRDEIPAMFTAQTFANILSKEAVTAAKEAAYGNWIIGQTSSDNNPALANNLLDQLRVAYINNYIDVWETFVANIQLVTPKSLTQLDNMIVTLTSNDSPLLQLLHILHENTYFEPITTSSARLQNLGSLLEKNRESENLLYQLFTSLQALHQYVQAIQRADNEKKAAFEAVSHRMLDPEKPDALARLWITAGKTPEPIKNWMNKLANTTWHFLMQDAGKYLDTSWQEQVIRVYQSEIANKYPFNNKTTREISLEKFASFFGKPGVITDFYQNYLQGFIDTSTPDWHWKTMHDEKLPFSENIVKQIQQAMQIHQVFFPNNDDKLYLQFALQPYQFGKNIKSVKFTINDKQIVDKKPDTHTSHIMSWGTGNVGKATYHLTLANKKVISKDFPGEWGWFKLVNQSFDSAVNKKDLLINLSHDNLTAKYLLSTEGQVNPFLSAHWRHLNLPQKLGS